MHCGFLERDLAPDWLRESWSHAQQPGPDRLSIDEIEAKIAAQTRDARVSRELAIESR